MALKIRLSRGGAKKRPFYRVVVADSRKPRDGRFIERIGSYNPMVPKDHPERFVINEERAKHWLGVGALPTNRVAQYLSGLGMVEKPAIPVQTKKDKPRAKTLERMKEQEEKAAVEEAAQADEASEEAAAEEAPAEEVAAEEVAAEGVAAEEAPAEGVAAEEAPAEEVAAEEVPAEEAPVEDAAAEEVPAEEAAEEETKEEG